MDPNPFQLPTSQGIQGQDLSFADERISPPEFSRGVSAIRRTPSSESSRSRPLSGLRLRLLQNPPPSEYLPPEWIPISDHGPNGANRSTSLMLNGVKCVQAFKNNPWAGRHARPFLWRF